MLFRSGTDTEDKEQEQEPTAKDSKGVSKRIGKLLAEKRELEAKESALAEDNAKLQARIEELEAAGRRAGATEDPVDAVPAVRELKEKYEKAKGVASWAKELLRRFDADPMGVTDALVKQHNTEDNKIVPEDPDAAQSWLERVLDNATEDAANQRASLAVQRARQQEYVEATRVQATREALQIGRAHV